MIEFKVGLGKRVQISGDHFDEIREHFSVKNEAAFFMRKKGHFFVKDRDYCITPTGLFESGLFEEVHAFVKTTYTDEIKIAPDVMVLTHPKLLGCQVYDELELPLRDYQTKTVAEAIAVGRGIIKLGTGAGKTLVTASLLSSIWKEAPKMMVLLIVPGLSLVQQTYTDFEDYGVPFKMTRWTGSVEPDLTSNVIIANTGIVQSRFDENPWILSVTALIIDEVHKVGGATKLGKIVTKIKTYNKFGLTGTLPDSKKDAWGVIGKIGQVIYEKNSFELREEKFLTNVGVKIINIKYNEKPKYVKGENKFYAELDFLRVRPYRNKIISTLSKNFNNNVLIMVNHIAHGQTLYDELSKLEDKKVYFIRGEVEVADRVAVVEEMERNNNVVCIAISAIFSTGINIKNLHMIIFASGGKSFIRTIQSVGRGLRLNENKEKLTIIDIADKLKYSEAHGERRKEIYNAEKISWTETALVEN